MGKTRQNRLLLLPAFNDRETARVTLNFRNSRARSANLSGLKAPNSKKQKNRENFSAFSSIIRADATKTIDARVLAVVNVDILSNS